MPDLRDHGGSFGGTGRKKIKNEYDIVGTNTILWGGTRIFTIDDSEGEYIGYTSGSDKLAHYKNGVKISDAPATPSPSFNFSASMSSDQTHILIMMLDNSQRFSAAIVFNLTTRTFEPTVKRTFNGNILGGSNYRLSRGVLFFITGSLYYNSVGSIEYSMATRTFVDRVIEIPGFPTNQLLNLSFNYIGEPLLSYKSPNTITTPLTCLLIERDLTSVIQTMTTSDATLCSATHTIFQNEGHILVNASAMYITMGGTIYRVSLPPGNGTLTLSHTFTLNSVPAYATLHSGAMLFTCFHNGRMFITPHTSHSGGRNWNPSSPPFLGDSTFELQFPTELNPNTLAFIRTSFSGVYVGPGTSNYSTLTRHHADYSYHGVLRFHRVLYNANTMPSNYTGFHAISPVF